MLVYLIPLRVLPFFLSFCLLLYTRWRPSLMYWATSRKVTGSFPDGITGIFHWHNPYGRTMSLGLTQPLTETSTSNVSLGGKGVLCVWLTKVTTFMCQLFWNMGASTSWNPQGLSRPVMGVLYLLTFNLFPFRLMLCNMVYRHVGRCSSFGIATGYGLDGPGIESRWGRDFPHLSRPALGPTQPPVQWVLGFSPGVKNGRGVTLTPHPLIVPLVMKE